jgi:hypothetical protein
LVGRPARLAAAGDRAVSAGRCQVFHVSDPASGVFVWVICEKREEAASIGAQYLSLPGGTHIKVREFGGDLLIAPYAVNAEHALAAWGRAN